MEEYRQLSQLIEFATSETVKKPDINQFTSVAQAIRSRSDMPKEAVKVFSKRLATKNTQVLMLTLELMEFCTFACEINLHNQFQSKDFLLRLGSILNNKDIDQIVKNRNLAMIHTWSKVFQTDIHTLFFNFYENVKQKGFEIPVNYESGYRQYKGQILSSPEKNQQQQYQQPSSYQEETTNYQPNYPSQKINYNQPSQGVSQKKPLSNKLQKLKDNIKIMEDNMVLINNLIDEHRLGSPVQSNETLFALAENLESRKEQFQGIIGQLEDESMLSYTISVNEILLKTLERYKALKRGQKPPPLRDDQVEEEILRQIQEMELRDSQIKQQSQQKQQEFQFNGQDSWSVQKPQVQQAQQPIKQQQQQQQKPQQMVENLIDLLDDEPEPPKQQQQPTVQQKKQEVNQIDLFDQIDLTGNSTVQVQPNQNQNPQPQQNFQQQTNVNNVPQQQQNQQPVVDKYAVLDLFSSQPVQNNMMYSQQQMQFQQQQQQQFNQQNYPFQQQQMNYNNMNPQQQFNSQVPFNNLNNSIPQQQQWAGNNNQRFQQPVQNFQSQQPQFQKQTQLPQQQQFSTSLYQNQQQQNYQNQQNVNNFKFSSNDANNQQQPNPFDDLDDMFGIKVPQKGGQVKTQQQTSKITTNNNDDLL